ncbi:MAG TPA: type III pantothenate kinase [Rhabdochlamydiaceae bacterium]|jgi:type III pantothenate kinase|nr:type III pantothenate kinase [Rhabdochlamydiaceae bacterium]
MKLVVDVGTQKISVGLFEGDRLLETSQFKHSEELLAFLKAKNIEQGIVAGESKGLLFEGFPCKALVPSDFKQLATEETFPLLKPDRIANIFGALYHFPSNDCVIVDIGTTIRFDYVTKHGIYLGGAIFPTFLTGELPPVLGRDQQSQEKSGCYFGLLGAIERIVAELRLSSKTPSGVMTVATGGRARTMQHALEDFIDKVDPELTLIGLNQILKETK